MVKSVKLTSYYSKCHFLENLVVKLLSLKMFLIFQIHHTFKMVPALDQKKDVDHDTTRMLIFITR